MPCRNHRTLHVSVTSCRRMPFWCSAHCASSQWSLLLMDLQTQSRSCFTSNCLFKWNNSIWKIYWDLNEMWQYMDCYYVCMDVCIYVCEMLIDFFSIPGPMSCGLRLFPFNCCFRCCRVPAQFSVFMICLPTPSSNIFAWHCPKMAFPLCLRFLSSRWPSSWPCCPTLRFISRCRLRYAVTVLMTLLQLNTFNLQITRIFHFLQFFHAFLMSECLHFLNVFLYFNNT